MKILHTSDWHLGHLLYNYDRTEEQRAMLQQIEDIVREQKPDVLLISGDVYHTATPSNTVQTMLSDALVNIHNAYPELIIVVTAGNHDSPSRHEIFRTPWQALNVYSIGQLEKDNLDSHIVEVPRKGFIAAVPYVNERNIPEGFFQQLLDRVAERNSENLPVVLSAHTTVKGADFTGHERATELTVGGIDSTDLTQMGEGYDYLALGHIHHEQFVHSGKHNVRYSGTPIAISFDESYEHSVSMVTIGGHGERPEVEKIVIENPRPLVTLPVEGATSWEEAKELLSQYPDDIPAYIRLNVEVKDFLPSSAYDEARLIAKDKQSTICFINAKRTEAIRTAARAMTVQELQEESPIDIARRFATDSGIEFDEEMEKMFNEVMRMVEEDKRNE